MRTILLFSALLAAACYGTHFDNGELRCSSIGECPDGYTCQIDHCYTSDTRGLVGQACAGEGECLGLCSGRWCTQSCAYDSGCPSGSACVTAASKSNYCFISCQADADCTRYGGDVGCVSASSVGGGRVRVCSTR